MSPETINMLNQVADDWNTNRRLYNLQFHYYGCCTSYKQISVLHIAREEVGGLANTMLNRYMVVDDCI